jgi:hypothetical protein
MRQMGFWKATTISIAQGGTIITTSDFDESNDEAALQAGWDYQDKLLSK